VVSWVQRGMGTGLSLGGGWPGLESGCRWMLLARECLVRDDGAEFAYL
jgi:hypothetical protein